MTICAPPLALFVNGHWVDDLSPFLIRFTENFGIRYYGLAYLLGFALALWLLHRYVRAGRAQLPREKVEEIVVAIVLGVLIGGRLGYFILYEPTRLLHEPLALFRVWDGGMASHGGFIGVTIALWWFSRREHVSFFHIGDLVASTTPAGLFFGRIANFINGELPGKVSDVRWAMIFPHSGFESPNTPLHLILPRHPSQLYEAALEGALLFALVQWRFWRTDVVRTQPGRLSGEFLIAYAIVRMIGEIFREPDASLFFGLSRGTFYSIFLIVAGLALIVRGRNATPVASRPS
jgi:phosphatidylglycerol---prolipoprotein diacylglyceryl transferase